MICCVYCIVTWYVLCICGYLYFTFYINVFISFFINIRSRLSCVQSLIGNARLMPVFANFVFRVHPVDVGWWLIILCWKFLNYEVYKHVFNFLIYIRIFPVSPLLLNGIHKIPFNIREFFWDVKMENGIFGQIQKTETQNFHAFSYANWTSKQLKE